MLKQCRLHTSSQPTQQTDPDTISIHTPMEALDFLLTRNLIPTWQPISYNNLATALIHIAEAQKIPKPLEEAICSISILLTDLTDRKLALDISTDIHKRLLGTNGSLHPIIKKLKGLSTDIKLTSTNLADTAEKIRNDNDNMAQNSQRQPQAPHFQWITAPHTQPMQQHWQHAPPPPPTCTPVSLLNVTYTPNKSSSIRHLMCRAMT